MELSTSELAAAAMTESEPSPTGNPSFDLRVTNQHGRNLRGVLVASVLAAILFVQFRVGLVVDVAFFTSLRDGSWPAVVYLVIAGVEIPATAFLVYLLVLVLRPSPTRLEIDRKGLTLSYPASRTREIPWAEFPARWRMIRYAGSPSRAPAIRSFLDRRYYRLIYLPDDAPPAIAQVVSRLGFLVRIEPFNEGQGEEYVVTAKRP